ncbi:NLR family CARD domain-containing protein 3 [Solea solea]|uniref:NLR family CARD domain-containing protein 3 n=1 Tax=Solea solea TaxID=90069 RepID=UPI00272AC4C8|nr:NLR family CARD domain-containing protein 3 [Solea solea]
MSNVILLLTESVMSGAMDPDYKMERPPSSYGSMRSESEESEDEGGEDKEVAMILPGFIPIGETRMQLIRPSESPETLYTVTTQQPPPGAAVIDTREYYSDNYDDDEDMEENLIATSPEPPEPVEPDDTTQSDENFRLGRMHPEQDLPHIFRSIQSALANLTEEELYFFKIGVLSFEKSFTRENMMEGDLLDLVDMMLEILGQDRSLMVTINTLESIKKKTLADELQNECRRAWTRFQLKDDLIRKHQIIFEGVPRAGKCKPLDVVYVEPQISTSCYGGVDQSHEFHSHPLQPLQIPSPDTFVSLNNLFRLQKADGTPVRTVLTTGIPGIGMSVSVAKFCLDWAKMQANRDLQFVIKLSFHSLWNLRNQNLPYSIMEVIKYYHPECKDMRHLDKEDCKFLIIMDSFDCYQAPLDWENSPVINDNDTQAPLDILIVNILRGTVLRGALIWILGRRAAVSQIPSNLIDMVTEIHGFSDEMKDDYFSRRFSNAEQATNILEHYKRLPTLCMLARQPFVCWMIATVFERCYRSYQGYGEHPPRLTPFYIHILIVQTNRRLMFYYGKQENNLKWSEDDKQLLVKMGHMAFKMIERKTSVFYEEEVKGCGLNLTEVAVFSGLCTELPAAASDTRRTFCFIHFTFQEFMAALYVFKAFHIDNKNVLDSHRTLHIFKNHQNKSAALLQSALDRTLSSPLGDYDMFLRFLCGLLSPACHNKLLSGFLFPHDTPAVAGREKMQQLLEKKIQTAPADRVRNLQECLREMNQEDD